MRALIYLNRAILMALLINIFAATNVVLAQNELAQKPVSSPLKLYPSPLKLYIDENGRLKQQKVALIEENDALKQTLQQEQQRSAQLQNNLAHLQPVIAERDHQL